MGRTSDAKERLIEATAELIYTQGYGGAGVDALCSAAGVKKGSFYHFFRSKRELALAALDAQWEPVKALLIDPLASGSAPPLSRIRDFFVALAGAVGAEQRARGHIGGCRFGNLSAEVSGRDEPLQNRLREIFSAIARAFEAALRQAREQGVTLVSDPATGAEALVAYMEGILLMAKTHNRASSAEQLGRHATALVCRDLNASDPVPPSPQPGQRRGVLDIG